MATWTAGTALASGALITQAWVQNVVNAQRFLAANDATYGKDLFYARQGTGQALTTNVGAALTFGGEDIDVADGHSTATNTSRYTARAGGKYRLIGGIAVPSTAVNQQIIGEFRRNGTAVHNAALVSMQVPNVSIAQTVPMPVTFMSLQGTSTNGTATTPDYVELWVTAVTAGFTTPTTPVQCYFGVEWVAP